MAPVRPRIASIGAAPHPRLAGGISALAISLPLPPGHKRTPWQADRALVRAGYTGGGAASGLDLFRFLAAEREARPPGASSASA